MKAESRKPKAVSRATSRLTQLPRPAFRFPLSAFPSPRAALTLIELLVTIVILVTLLAAVLPAVSPNNEGRKIREASRQLVSLFHQAQAQAARDGRPVGVGFRDTWNDADNDNVIDPGELTGMAIEAYIIAEPPPFAGFSTGAAAAVMNRQGNPFVQVTNAPLVGPGQPPIVNIVFVRGVGGEGLIVDGGDAIPPQTFRGAFIGPNGGIAGSGDLVEIGQELFELISNDCDDADNDTDTTPDTEDGTENGYLKSQTVVAARWLSHRNRTIQLLARGGKAYRIRRSPMANTSPSRTAAESIQFPRGIGIDFDPTDGNWQVGVVFSPTGAIDAVYMDGQKQSARPFFMMLGQFENANPWNGPASTNNVDDIDYTKYDFTDVPQDSEGDDEVALRRRETNLLNADSRWVVVSPAGRVVASENAFFDPRQDVFVNGTPPNTDDSPPAQRERQRDAARQYAANYESEGGG
jgi:type II secretory pathway pseudopilin PulG